MKDCSHELDRFSIQKTERLILLFLELSKKLIWVITNDFFCIFDQASTAINSLWNSGAISINSGAIRPNHCWVGGHCSEHISESIARFSKTCWTIYQSKSVWKVVRDYDNFVSLLTLLLSIYFTMIHQLVCTYTICMHCNLYCNWCSIRYQYLSIHQNFWITL